MYLKILGSVFLLASTASIGFLKAGELKIRTERLNELKKVMLLLQGEFRFRRAPIPEAFEAVSKKAEAPFAGFLESVAAELEAGKSGNFLSIWEKQCGELLSWEGMKREDQQLLEQLGSSLGCFEVTLQLEMLQGVIRQTEEVLKTAKEQQEVRGKLYQTMGVSLGALLTLLII